MIDQLAGRRNRHRTQRLATAHEIPRVHDTLDELLADPEVAVIDIAVTPDGQVDIALRLIEALYRSGETGQVVAITPGDTDQAWITTSTRKTGATKRRSGDD